MNLYLILDILWLNLFFFSRWKCLVCFDGLHEYADTYKGCLISETTPTPWLTQICFNANFTNTTFQKISIPHLTRTMRYKKSLTNMDFT